MSLIIAPMFVIDGASLFSYHQYAQFVEEIDGNGDEGKGERIAGGGDDGGSNDNGQKSVATILTHGGGSEQPKATEEPADDGQFEKDTQKQTEHQQSVDIALEGNEVGNFR